MKSPVTGNSVARVVQENIDEPAALGGLGVVLSENLQGMLYLETTYIQNEF